MQNVAAYCRVSTDKEDQINSMESQKKYFSEYIQRNPLWNLTEVYVDEGITGTSTKKRRAFNKMIADAQSHKFDLIITKEISRFARNTLDSIFYTRKLKKLGIGVVFMNDNINTLDPDAELRLTITSSIAQEESRKTSERVKWGQKRRMEQGVVFGRSMLGYDVRDGKIYVNKEGAEVVRLIFHKFVNEGKGTHVIARELYEAGVPTMAYMKQWSNVGILRLLRNEKYCGDLIQKKTYTPSYLDHEKKCNHGEEEFIVLHDHHEPIISRAMFDLAQQELKRRSPSEEQKIKHSSRYCFSGKIKCGFCGSSFVSRTKKRKDSSVYKAWRCYGAAAHGSKQSDSAGNAGGCNCRSLNEEDLKLIMQQIVKNLLVDKKSMVKNVIRIVKAVVCIGGQQGAAKSVEAKINQIIEKKQKLVELYISKNITMDEFERMNQKFEKDMAALEKEKQALSVKNEPQITESFDDLDAAIAGLSDGDVWDDTFYRNILHKIVVKDKNILDVYLNNLPAKTSYLIIDCRDIKKHLKNSTGNMQEELYRHFDSAAGTEELAHLEMVGTIVYQLTRDLTIDEIKKSGFDGYFVDHTTGVYPADATGNPYSAATMQSTGDTLADLHENMAAEQKARKTYDNILRFCDDPDVKDPIRFLREREIVHYQRFGEGLRITTDKLDSKNFYAFNPSFDKKSKA